VNVSSSLLINGWAGAWGSWQIIDGGEAFLNVFAYLNVWRWSGWGTDPDTGQSNDQTLYPGSNFGTPTVVADLLGFGGTLFTSASPAWQTLGPNPYDVGASLIAIPGQAVTVFDVNLYFVFSFGPGTGSDQNVLLDMATDGYIAKCPFLALEVLTGPPW
jgi:hypothetical protein